MFTGQKRKVRFIVPGSEYPWTPEGFDTTFHLRILAPTTVRRIIMEVSSRLGYEPETIPNPNPGPDRPATILADTANNKRFIMEAAVRLASEALVRWEGVEDNNGEMIEYNPEQPDMLEYIADVEVLDAMYLEIQKKSIDMTSAEKKRSGSTLKNILRRS